MHHTVDARGVATVQRIENAAIALFTVVAAIVAYPGWWWILLAAFLAFDLSALGYLRSPRVGAVLYNVVHNYTGAALVGVAAILAWSGGPDAPRWLGLLALSWAFHVGVDRALGYGLKLPDAFQHTHLGTIGRAGTKATPRDVSDRSG